MQHSLTYNDMLGAYQPYPAPIRPFLLRAQSHPLISTLLTKSNMRVLIDIIGRAPIADPTRPLWLRVDTVAETLNISITTVKRAIRMLKSREWLVPNSLHDGRNNWGEFSAKEYLLGTELRSMLGLPNELTEQELPNSNNENITETPYPQQEKFLPIGQSDNNTLLNQSPTNQKMKAITTHVSTESPSLQVDDIEVIQPEKPQHSMIKNDLRPKMISGLYRVNKDVKKEASFEEEASLIQTRKAKANPQTVIQEHATQQGAMQADPQPSTKEPKLPTELKEMAEILQIHPLGICALMRIAKQVNQKLQDLWRVKRDQLINAGAKEGRAFKYVKFLLETGEDFAYRARIALSGQGTPAKSRGSTKATTSVSAEALTAKGRSDLYLNQHFIGENGLSVRIQGNGSAVFNNATQKNVYMCPADMGIIYEAIEVGKLWIRPEIDAPVLPQAA